MCIQICKHICTLTHACKFEGASFLMYAFHDIHNRHTGKDNYPYLLKPYTKN